MQYYYHGQAVRKSYSANNQFKRTSVLITIIKPDNRTTINEWIDGIVAIFAYF